jgi:hypothetical protein
MCMRNLRKDSQLNSAGGSLLALCAGESIPHECVIVFRFFIMVTARISSAFLFSFSAFTPCLLRGARLPEEFDHLGMLVG